MLQNQKLLKKQLLHSRLRTLILFLILAVVTFSAFFIRGKVSEAMETFHDVTETLDETAERVQGAMATIESMNTTIDGVEVVIVQVREILDDLDLEAINTTVQNMESVSAALDRDIQAINIDGNDLNKVAMGFLLDSTFGKSSVQRHLTAFKTLTDTAAGTGFLTVLSAAAGFTVARCVAASFAERFLLGAFLRL